MLRINGIEVKATEFFYDGCHKIYVADNAEGYRQMYDAGWDDGDIYQIEELPAVWTGTCPLRFICSADLERTFVPQFEPAEFEGWKMDGWLKRELATMRREQLEANGEER